MRWLTDVFNSLLQDGNRCYCGNDYGRHGDTDTCNTKCSGTVEGDVCGGRLASNVWRVTAGQSWTFTYSGHVWLV